MAKKKITELDATRSQLLSLTEKYLAVLRWLRVLAIRQRYRPAYGIMVVMVGYNCAICENDWLLDEREEHAKDCPLFERKS